MRGGGTGRVGALVEEAARAGADVGNAADGEAPDGRAGGGGGAYENVVATLPLITHAHAHAHYKSPARVLFVLFRSKTVEATCAVLCCGVASWVTSA